MLFQVINDKGVPVMRTVYASCIPEEQSVIFYV